MKASAFRDSTFPLLPLGNVVTERAEYVDSIDFPPLSVGIEGITKQLEGVAKAASTSGRKLVRAGDLAINSRSDRRGACGLASTTGSVSIVNSVFTPHPEKLVPQFAHHLLRSKAFQEEYFRFGTGIVDDLWSTRFPRMRQIRIPLPDLPTQRRIADYLDRETAQIDAMTEALDGLVARLEERLGGLFKVATGDARQASLAVVSQITLGKMLDGNKNKGIPTPYIRAANVKRTGKIDTDDLKLMKVTPSETATYSLRADDIIMVEGGDAGRVGYVTRDLPGVAFQKTVMRIRCYTESAFPRYVYYALDDAHKSGRVSLDYSLSTIPHFPAEKAARLEIPLPPLEEQRRIVAHLDTETAKIDAMIAKAGELRALLDERRSALITATVTGQHPVPEEP